MQHPDPNHLVVLVDGSSYLFRAFHGLPPLTTRDGRPTGALHGVVKMLAKLYDDHQPAYIGVVFDAQGKTFRHDLYPAYKAHRAATQLYTYGYKKASILASLVNAVLLIYIVIKIFIEAFERLSNPPEMAGTAIMITAFIGVIINGLSAFLFYKGQQTDINIKGAFLHLLLDALVSVGVIVSGAIMYFTGWYIADPISSFMVGIVILFSTWGLLKESVKLILDGVPQNINQAHIQQLIEQHPMVESVHHLHIWALSSAQNALTAHLVLKECITLKEFMTIKAELKHTLSHEGITHSTFEIDTENCHCKEENCN